MCDKQLMGTRILANCPSRTFHNCHNSYQWIWIAGTLSDYAKRERSSSHSRYLERERRAVLQQFRCIPLRIRGQIYARIKFENASHGELPALYSHCRTTAITLGTH